MDLAHLAVFAGRPTWPSSSFRGRASTALVARVLARGTRGAPAFIAGFVAGAPTWFTLAATGLAVLASAFAGLFVAIRYAGAASLLSLAWTLWTAPIRPLAAARARRLFASPRAARLVNRVAARSGRGPPSPSRPGEGAYRAR